MKKSIKILFSLLSICSLVSCKKNNDNPEIEPEEPRYDVLGDKFLMENGVSEYVVLLSKNPQAKEKTAADEFTYFMKLATGYTFQVVDDASIRNNQKYISLGFTEKFKSNFPSYNYNEIDKTQSAYFISTKDDNIYLVCSDDFDGDGVLYGVYDLLQDFVNYNIIILIRTENFISYRNIKLRMYDILAFSILKVKDL